MSRVSVLEVCLALLFCSVSLLASTAEDLEKATKKERTVFLLVTDVNAAKNAEARTMVQAVCKQVNKSVLIELDRNDTANSALVAQYRLAGAPVPLVMIIAGNGAIAGGIPVSNTTIEQLVSMVPTDKKAEVLKAVQAGQSVMITATSKHLPKEEAMSSACAAACSQLQGKCSAIKIDLEDKDELPFLNELKINPATAEPVTVVINAQGQMAGSFQGAVEVGTLVQAATKKVGGCCSGGSSSSSCGPKKK